MHAHIPKLCEAVQFFSGLHSSNPNESLQNRMWRHVWLLLALWTTMAPPFMVHKRERSSNTDGIHRPLSNGNPHQIRSDMRHNSDRGRCADRTATDKTLQTVHVCRLVCARASLYGERSCGLGGVGLNSLSLKSYAYSEEIIF